VRLAAAPRRSSEPETKEPTMADKPDVPVFHGNGPDDYFCATCGNLLAERMPAAQMRKVRIRCGKCQATNCIEIPKA
jgi:ribosomal protein S27AE